MVYWFIILLVYFSTGFQRHSWKEIIHRNTSSLVCWVVGGLVRWVAGWVCGLGGWTGLVGGWLAGGWWLVAVWLVGWLVDAYF